MSRHTKYIYFNQSENDGMLLIGDNQPFYIPTQSDVLYFGLGSYARLGYDMNEIPANKIIVSAKFNIYANSSYSYAPIKIVTLTQYPDGTLNSNFIELPSINAGWVSTTVPDLLLNPAVLIRPQISQVYPPIPFTTFQSTRATTNRPYIEVIYDDLPPLPPSGLFPKGGTINPRDPITFSWTHNSQEGGIQKGFVLEYSTDNWTTKTTISQTTSNEYYEFAALTFPTTGTLLWRVKTIDENNEESEFATSSFTLGIVPQAPPVLIRPVSQYVDGGYPIRFAWNYIPNSQTSVQASYDLQYSVDNGISWTTISETGAGQYYDVPEGIFPSGTVLWKMRVTNNYGEISSYTEIKNFVVIDSPPNPTITNVTNEARPTVTWNSQQQNVYDIQIVQGTTIVFESGSIPSVTDRSYKVPVYLNDGTYRARLKIINEFDLSSDWVERQFTISTVKPTQPVITVFNRGYYTQINIESTTSVNQIYRDDEFLDVATSNIYYDYTAENNKRHYYYVRAIDENDNFNDSIKKSMALNFRGNTLAILKEPNDYVILKYGFNNFIGKTVELSIKNEFNFYDGREYPIVEYSEHTQEILNFGGFVETIEEIRKLENMIKKRQVMLYRDNKQGNFIGVVSSIQYDETRFGYTVSLTINKVVV